MMRATLFAACAALILSSFACVVIGGTSEGRPTVSPTTDLQATINAALARIETATAASPATPSSASGFPTPTPALVSAPAIPNDPVSATAPGVEPSPRKPAEPTMVATPTVSPASTPTVILTLTPTPTPTPAPTPAPTGARVPTPTAPVPNVEPRVDGPELEREIHQLINAERVSRGLTALTWDERIAEIARGHSEDMASNDYFSHDNLKGQGPTDRGNEAGYLCRKELGGGAYSYGLGENIWHGWKYSSYTFGVGVSRYDWMTQSQLADQAVSSWMGSPGHRQNILDSQYDRTGIGVGFGMSRGKPYAVYLTQNFC